MGPTSLGRGDSKVRAAMDTSLMMPTLGATLERGRAPWWNHSEVNERSWSAQLIEVVGVKMPHEGAHPTGAVRVEDRQLTIEDLSFDR